MHELRIREFQKQLDQLLDAYTDTSLRFIKSGCMECFGKKIQCTREFLDVLPNHPILQKSRKNTLTNMQCDNPFLTIDYVLKHNHLQWSWTLLSCNPSVATPDNLDKYPEIPWCLKCISLHVPFAYYLKHPSKCWWTPNLVRNSCIPIEYLVITVLNARSLHPGSFHPRDEWVPDMLSKFRQDPTRWSFVPNCFSYFDKCGIEELRANMDLDIPVRILSSKPYITKEFVMEHIHKPWLIDTMRKEIMDRELADAFLHAGKVTEYLVIMAHLVDCKGMDDLVREWSDLMTGKVWAILSRSQNIHFTDISKRKSLPWCWLIVARRRDAIVDRVPEKFMKECLTQRVVYAIHDSRWHDAIRIASHSKQTIPYHTYYILEKKLLDFKEWDARLHMAAYKIQQWWTKQFYDPTHPVCKRRLLREFRCLPAL